MSRFLLLLLFLIWMAWRAEGDAPTPARASDIALFFGLYLLMVGVLGAWSRLLSRRLQFVRLERALRYFNHVVFAVRMIIPVWFAVGVFFLGWGQLVQTMLGPVSRWPVQLPGAIIGTLPAILAWAGLWWSQYPAERALREHSLLAMFDSGDDQLLYRPPPFWSYMLSNLRLQVLFTAIPIFLILLTHDVIMLTMWGGLGMNVEQSAAEGIVTFASAIIVFLIVPEVLCRVLPTHPLPPSPLRERMEAMSRTYRLRFRDILIWRTHNRIANALVMGVVPRFRYVLLSDLLLQEMSDEQVEAVFAHELGHVVHRHMIWYLVFLKVLILVLAVMALAIEAQQHRLPLPVWMPLDLVITLLGFVAFLIAFGFVSRRFERQADVFAARTLQRHLAPLMIVDQTPAATALAPAHGSHVGPLGASLFASALERVARINNMPLGPRGRWEGGLARRAGYVMERITDAMQNWLHGSISQRMRALERMSLDPSHTRRFDRRMARLYVTILLALVVSSALAWVVQAPL